MKIVLSLAGDRALAANVEGSDRVYLPCIRLADDHPILLVHVGIRGRRLHAAELKRRPLVLVEIRKDRRCLHRLDWKLQRCKGANRTFRLRDIGAIFRQQKAGHTVIRTRAIDVSLNHLDKRDLASADRLVQIGDGRFLQPERPLIVLDLIQHRVFSLVSEDQRRQTPP